MSNWIVRQFGKLPQPWRLIAFLFSIAVLLAGIFALFGQVQSCGYDKARKEYEEQSKAWTIERTTLIANAEAKEKRIAELEPKAIAFDAVAEQNKKIDAGLAQQIEEVSKNAGEEEVRANEPTDCLTRVARVCERLRANGIQHDCFRITKESCGAGQ